MNQEDFLAWAQDAMKNPLLPLVDPAIAGEFAPIVACLNALLQENRRLRNDREQAISYIRRKVDQLLLVCGTIPLKSEELDDATLLKLDPIGVVAETFVQIIDHLRDTNKGLELTMEEIRAIFEAVGAGILVMDDAMTILSCNRRFREMFVPPGMEPIGNTCNEIVCKDASPEHVCPFKESMRTGEAVHLPEVALGLRTFDLVSTPIKNREGQVIRGVLLYVDITERKRIDDALAAEKERLAVTLASIAEGVVTTDTQGRITLMNQVAEDLSGWRRTDATGMPSAEVLWVVNEDHPRTGIDLPQRVLLRGDVVERSEDIILIAKDGLERRISASAAPIRDRSSSIAGVVMVFRDITEEKKLQDEILNARRIKSLGVMAGGIAHDFNNLLTGILGNITLAKMQVNAPAQLLARLAKAENATLRARDLTQQLLTFSKGGAPVRKTTCIAELLRETASFAIRGANIRCDFRIDPNLWTAEVDEGQIGQVINNLVINAEQAMPEGGAITIQAKNVALAEPNSFSLAQGKYVMISISDTGSGIAPHILDRVFDPYFTTKKEGSGLGLATSYAIIEKHGGHIQVESEPDIGTTFTIHLPASLHASQVCEEAEEGKEAKEATSSKETGGRILIMDDEEMVRDVVRALLEEEGYQVTVAAHGQEAIDLYTKAMKGGRPYDLVIMDLTVPGAMGGKEALSHLLAIDRRVKAVVSSGYSSDAVMADYQAYGFKGVVQKPYNAALLARVIREVLTENPTAGQ